MNIFKEVYLQFLANNNVLTLNRFNSLCRYCSLKLPQDFTKHAKLPRYARILKGYLRRTPLNEKEVEILHHYHEIWSLYASALRLKPELSEEEQKFLTGDFPDELFALTNIRLRKEFVDRLILTGSYKKLRHYAQNHGLPTSTEMLLARKAEEELKKGSRECFETLASYIGSCYGAFANYDSWVILLTSGSPEIVRLANKYALSADRQN